MKLTLGTGTGEDSTSGGLPQYGRSACVELPTGRYLSRSYKNRFM